MRHALLLLLLLITNAAGSPDPLGVFGGHYALDGGRSASISISLATLAGAHAPGGFVYLPIQLDVSSTGAITGTAALRRVFRSGKISRKFVAVRLTGHLYDYVEAGSPPAAGYAASLSIHGSDGLKISGSAVLGYFTSEQRAYLTLLLHKGSPHPIGSGTLYRVP